MRLLSASSILALLAFVPVYAEADQASPDQAQAIRRSLETYLGAGTGANGSPVTVTPEGDHYNLDVDVAKALGGLEPLGVKLEPLTYRLVIQPQDGGLWHVTHAGTTRVTAHMGEKTVSVIVNNGQFDGLFNPALRFFTHSTSSYDSLTLGSTGPDGADQTREIQQGKVELSGEPVGDGAVNIRITQSSAGSQQDMTKASAGATAGSQPEHVAAKVGTATEEGQISGLRIRALTDIWAFLVAHPGDAAITGDREQLRVLLRQALPIFDRWSQAVSFDHAAVESPLGPFTTQAASINISLNGLTEDGSVASSLKVDDLTIPTGLVPPWAEDLIPTKIDVSDSLSGYHLAGAAQEAVTNLDFSGAQPLSPETLARMKELLGPMDQMTVKLAPSRLVSKLLDARIEGQVTLKQPLPDYAATIAIKGLDDAIKDVQAKAGGDEHANQLVAVLLMAKGFGKAQTDGSVSWVITPNPQGGVLVNGVAMPFGTKQ
jgi:hypothetical protein